MSSSADKDDISNVIGTELKTSRGLKNKAASPCSVEDDGPLRKDKGDGKTGNHMSCWANSGESYWGIAKTFEILPSKCYKAGMSQTGPYLDEVPIVTDNLLILPDDASKQILSDFTEFWKLKPHFQERGFLHKRGILMWGPPGSGKTSTIQLIIQKVIKDLQGIVLMIDNPTVGVEALKMIRKIEPNRPVIAVLEDLDSLVNRFDEAGFLSLLDGEAQVDNIVHLATTNYPERLDPRFIDRPSRFDVVRKIDMPSAEARKFYLENKEPSLTPEELSEWVRLSEGLTIPHLKEMIISVRCYKCSLDDTVARLTKMHKKKFKDGKDLGFGGN